jgi:hypothetical protein
MAGFRGAVDLVINQLTLECSRGMRYGARFQQVREWSAVNSVPPKLPAAKYHCREAACRGSELMIERASIEVPVRHRAEVGRQRSLRNTISATRTACCWRFGARRRHRDVAAEYLISQPISPTAKLRRLSAALSARLPVPVRTG